VNRTVIVGGGLSGLTAAFYLSKYEIPVTIVEPRNRLGGVFVTEQAHGCTIEGGPDGWLTAKPAAAELIRELGLDEQLIGSLDHQRAVLIWRGGRLHRLPEDYSLMVPASVRAVWQTTVLSRRGRLRMLGDLLSRPPAVQQDCTIATFIARHFGDEPVDYIAEPLLAGVYGGRVDELSAQSVAPKIFSWEQKYGSLIRGARQEGATKIHPLFTTLRDGVSVLTNRLAATAKFDLVRGTVERVEMGSSGARFRVRVNGDWLLANYLIIACPPGKVLPNLFPAIEYRGARVLVLIYRGTDAPRLPRGFGFLVPARERRHFSACTFVGQKFPHRVPEGVQLLRVFVTGSAEGALEEVQQKLGIRGQPLWQKLYEWPEAMAQYKVGHQDLVQFIGEMLKDLPGLYLAGNAYEGVGIPDCIRLARGIAERIASSSRAGAEAPAR
jgi:oxygen-dependent protoporphyrinogen oxidase